LRVTHWSDDPAAAAEMAQRVQRAVVAQRVQRAVVARIGLEDARTAGRR